MRSRSFFYVCAGVLMLAIAYTIGASQATSQTGSGSILTMEVSNYGADTDRKFVFVITDAGDVHVAEAYSLGTGNRAMTPSTHLGNIFTGGPISVEQSTMTDVKSKYRDEEDE